MTRHKTAFCVGKRCNQERPVVKTRAGHVCIVCRERVLMRSKFGNVPVRSKHTGRLIQSKKEAAWEPYLLALQNSGQIRDLVPQGPLYKFAVFSNEPVRELLRLLQGPEFLHITDVQRAVRDIEHSMVQIPGSFRPDYSFYDSDERGGAFHVQDIKSPGTRTMQYRRNKALLLACFSLECEEPEPGRGVQQRARGCGIRGRGTGSRLMGSRRSA